MKKVTSFLLVFQVISILIFSQRPAPTDTLSPEKAIGYYKSILERNKNSSYATYGMAMAYYVLGDYRTAIKYSKQNIKSESEYQADCYLIYACSLDRTKFYDDASKIFEKAIKLFPNNDQLYYQYALSCYKMRELDKALPLVAKAISVQPLNIEAHYLNGVLLFESSNNKKSVGAFLYALMLDNDTARSKYAVLFVTEFIAHKQENISIPFFDKRAAISGVDNIFQYYFPEKTKARLLKEMKPELVAESVESYLKMEMGNMGEYKNLYESMAEKNFTKAFCHYILRGLGSEYIREWYKVNGLPLKAFADFLDKKLPEI